MINVLTYYWSALVSCSCLDGDERSCVTCKILCVGDHEIALQLVMKAP
ncbi:Uncharacterized protein PFLU_4687 [Pseudomonas [fluorescens] SBW25]|uniref:Uncharacterized protein n=1 Tax=Pseudomonas fluorescens (strain SBW25) TaxID=216595 RepID=C3K0L6_PSEFS|nr:Uncharacterized protein PFLU_4687 [Pseudomonas fluorescens SBW25]